MEGLGQRRVNRPYSGIGRTNVDILWTVVRLRIIIIDHNSEMVG